MMMIQFVVNFNDKMVLGLGLVHTPFYAHQPQLVVPLLFKLFVLWRLVLFLVEMETDLVELRFANFMYHWEKNNQRLHLTSGILE